MNDRIKELARQAGLIAPYGSDREGLRDFDYREFAELIVKECIDVVKPTSHHDVWAQSYLGGVDGLDLLYSKIKDIKQHFGVEE